MTTEKSYRVSEQIAESYKVELNRYLKRALLPIEDPDSLWVRIPENADIDLSVAELSRLVIVASNTFTEATRFAGMAKAELDRAEALHKQKLKEAYDNEGKNAELREAIAYRNTEEQHAALMLVRQVADLAQSAELAARVASESARKLLDKAQSIQVGESRAEHGRKYEPTALDTGF